MTIQTSSSNKNRFKGCFTEAFMRNKSIGIFYFCLSFLFLPTQYIMALQRLRLSHTADILHEFFGPAYAYTGFSSVMFPILTVAMAFASPIIIFSYMQNKRAVDVYHSLPYTRNELLGAGILSGLLYIMIPIIIDFSVIAVVSVGVPGSKPILILAEILYWFPTVIGVFSVTTLVCVLVGTTFDSFLFSVGLHVTPISVWLMLKFLGSGYILGFDESVLLDDFSIFSPAFIRMPYFTEEQLSKELFINQITICVVWVFISLALTALSFYCYNKRKSEQAETSTESGPLSMLLRLVGTTVGGILLAILFSSTLLSTNGYYSSSFIIWVFISSFIVYLVGDVIISKRIRNIKKALIPGGSFSLAVVVLVSCYFFDITGYSKKLPERDEIVSVTLHNYSLNYAGRFSNQPYATEKNKNIEYTSPEVIDAVFDYHKAQVDAINRDGIAALRLSDARDANPNFYFSTIEYKLSSGKTLSRNFRKSFDRSSNDSIYKLESSTEFIEKNHPVFKMDEGMVTAVNTINLLGTYSESLNLSSREKDELIAALRQDMLSQSGRNLLESKPLGKFIFFLDENEFIEASDIGNMDNYAQSTTSLEVSITVTDAFKSTLSFMERLGKRENFENKIEDVHGAFIDHLAYDSKAVTEINYNMATSNYYNEDISLKLSVEELKQLEPHMRGFTLFNTPHINLFFVSNLENLEKIREIAKTDADDTVAYDLVDEQRTNNESDKNEKTITGMAFVPYEKLDDSIKIKFLKHIKESGATNDWELSDYGMTMEFYEEEMAKYKISFN